MSNQSGKRGGRRPGAGRPRGAVSETTKTIREICRSITLDNPKVVARLTREAELGTINPSVLINLIDRGWGRPIPMEEAEKPRRDPLIFLGLKPWEVRTRMDDQTDRMIAEQAAEEQLRLEKANPTVVIAEDEADTLESVVIPPEPVPDFTRPIRERDRLPGRERDRR